MIRGERCTSHRNGTVLPQLVLHPGFALFTSHAVRTTLRLAEDLLRLDVVAVWLHGQAAFENLFLRKQHARPYHVLFLLLVSAVLGERRMCVQIDTDADRRALVQQLKLDRGSAMIAAHKQADEREQALRQQSQRLASVRSEIKAVLVELDTVTSQRQEAVDKLAAQNRQFAIEIAEYRKQVVSIAGSPDPRKRGALAAYVDGDRKNAFTVLVDIQKAEERAVAAGWLELGSLATDMHDRGELSTGGYRHLRASPEG